MSRIGKKAIDIPENVKANIADGIITVSGPKGELSASLFDDVDVQINDNSISVAPKSFNKKARSFWGLTRTLISNLVAGVSEGFMKTLEIQGVGYRAQIQGNTLQLALGFSHDVKYEVPEGIEIKCAKPTEITIEGIDKQKVGQTAAEIRRFRPPEPYKGKGIRYKDEYVFRKEGKKK
jgi:large subunit ribosomal protein L6